MRVGSVAFSASKPSVGDTCFLLMGALTAA